MPYTYPSGEFNFDMTRQLIPDTTAPFTYSDDEINRFLYATSSQGLYVSGQAAPLAASQTVVPQIYSPYLAAALALDTIASRLSQLAALEQLLDVKLNCQAGAKEAREGAKTLRTFAAERGDFAIAEMVNTQFAARERVWAQLLRIEGN